MRDPYADLRGSGDEDDEETVWVNTRTRAGRPPRIHTDPDCTWLQKGSTIVEKPRSVFTDRPLCKHCAGTAETFRAEESTKATRKLLLETDADDVGGGEA